MRRELNGNKVNLNFKSKEVMKTKSFVLMVFTLAAALRVEAQAPPQFFSVHSFDGSAGEGTSPIGNLVQDPDGNIFGVTKNGGTSNANNGTFFALLPVGGNNYNFTNLYNFSGGTNGGHPAGDLTLQANGQAGNIAALHGKLPGNGNPNGAFSEAFFGTATAGGEFGYAKEFKFLMLLYSGANIVQLLESASDLPPPGTGAVAHVEQTLIRPKIVASGNTLYGVNVDSIGDGGVYSINTNGTGFKVLHYFGFLPNPFYPNYSLTLSGNTLYGTTRDGGLGTGFGYGTVFSINTDGSNFAVLHYFTNGADGYQPMGGVLLSGDTLYGTTFHGGTNYNGTVFKMNTNGSNYQVIGAFDGYYAQGGGPAPVRQHAAGNNTVGRRLWRRHDV